MADAPMEDVAKNESEVEEEEVEEGFGSLQIVDSRVDVESPKEKVNRKKRQRKPRLRKIKSMVSSDAEHEQVGRQIVGFRKKRTNSFVTV
jgi:hypothetical protein